MLRNIGTAFLMVLGFMLSFTTSFAGKMGEEANSVQLEAESIYEECRASFVMSTFYDCNCFKEKFAQKRREVGETQGRDAIMFYVGNNAFECKNASGVANQKSKDCKSNSFMLQPDLQSRAEEYCNCYGEEFSKHYMNLMERYTKEQSRIFTMKATRTCKDRFAGRAK